MNNRFMRLCYNFYMRIKQLNIDCYGCKGNLENAKALVKQMEKSAKESGAKILGTSVKNYPIFGFTAVTFLAESHIIVSTYPEYRYAVVEIFMCNDIVSPKKCWLGIEKYLKPSITRKNEWYHHIGKSPSAV